MTDFNTGSTLVAISPCVRLYFGVCISGPLIVALLSGYSDRVLFYNICNVLLLIRTYCQRSSSQRSIAGGFPISVVFIAGVTTTTIGSGIFADVMPAQTRGRAMALWSL